MTLADPVRLEALRRSGLLGRPATERLRRLVRTAAEMVQADAAQLNLVDEHLVHHVALWPVPDGPEGPWPSEQSGCQHVVGGEVFAVQDSVLHPLTCELPWTGTWRGYLGAPVLFQGEPVGALCVLTRQPREWTSVDVLALSSVATYASHALA